jgi:DNA-binding MarR family transcriptional regulator/GNAT superfamily N-acetyltransferase
MVDGGNQIVDPVNHWGAAVKDLQDRVATVRAFNRFYTQLLGLLQEGLHESDFSLTEVRILYDLSRRDRPTAAVLGSELGLDAGYMSRILRRFERMKLVERRPSPHDKRRVLLELTEKGRAAFEPLDRRSSEQVTKLLEALSETEQMRVIDAMIAIGGLLGRGGAKDAEGFSLREPLPGDLGWVIHRQAVLYWQEYRWDERYEALVAKIVGEFVESFDPERERCWIADRYGEVVGSVFLVKKSATIAKLRLLYVEPSARGLGVGSRLVQECIGFARAKGYKRMTLWTNSVLTAARRIYEREGFELVKEEKHTSFGHDLVGQTWELAL